MYNTTKRVENSNISIVKATNFFSESLIEYIVKFENLKKQGVITINSDFKANSWRLADEVNTRTYVFDFNKFLFESQKKKQGFSFEYEDFIIAVKCFTLILLDRYRIMQIGTFINSFKKTITSSNYFNDENIKETKKLYREKVITEIDVHLIMDFIDYFDILFVSDKYYYLMETECYRNESNQRILPSFESMFKFTEIINLFIEEDKKEHLEKFFPVVLWWVITAQIPLRVTEFTIMPYNCLKVENDIYKLIVMRCIAKGYKSGNDYIKHNIEDNFEEQEIEINKALFELIEKYKLLVDKYDYIENFYGDGLGGIGQRRFLLSYRSYYNFLNNCHKYKPRGRYYLDYMDSKVLRSLITQFFAEIVFKEKGYNVIEKKEKNNPENTDIPVKNIIGELMPYEIERIQTMDTRHFAIMNMIMSDIPIVAVKMLSGHRNINTTYGYYRNLDKFIENYTYYLAHKYAREDCKGKVLDMRLDSPPIAKVLYYHEKIANSEIKAEKVEGGSGWCIYQKEDITPCKAVAGKCKRGCNYYIPKDESAENINKTIEGNKSEIDSVLEVIQDLIKNRKTILDFEKRFKVEMGKIRIRAKQNAKIYKEHFVKIFD